MTNRYSPARHAARQSVYSHDYRQPDREFSAHQPLYSSHKRHRYSRQEDSSPSLRDAVVALQHSMADIQRQIAEQSKHSARYHRSHSHHSSTHSRQSASRYSSSRRYRSQSHSEHSSISSDLSRSVSPDHPSDSDAEIPSYQPQREPNPPPTVACERPPEQHDSRQRESRSPTLQEDPTTMTYYAPPTAEFVITNESIPPVGTITFNRRSQGLFTITSYSPLAFKLRSAEQVKAFQDFLNACTKEPPLASDSHKVGTAHRQSVAAFAHKLKAAAGFYPELSCHRFAFDKTMPFSEVVEEAFNSELQAKHSEQSLKTLVLQSRLDLIAKALKSSNKKDSKLPTNLVNTQPPFGLNPEGGGMVLNYLTAPPLTSEDKLAATRAPGVHFDIPSAEARAAHLLARADTMSALSEALAHETVQEQITIIRKDFKDKLPPAADQLLQAVQATVYTRKHYALREASTHARKTAQAHMLMRLQACHPQNNPSVQNSFVQGSLLSPYLLHEDTTASVFADTQLQSLIRLRHSSTTEPTLTPKPSKVSSSTATQSRQKKTPRPHHAQSFRQGGSHHKQSGKRYQQSFKPKYQHTSSRYHSHRSKQNTQSNRKPSQHSASRK